MTCAPVDQDYYLEACASSGAVSKCCPAVCPMAAAIGTEVRYWLMDTGCGHDIMNITSMTPGQKRNMTDSNSPLIFDTANGHVAADKQIALHIPALGPIDYQASPYCLHKSPNVLTICYRTQEHGFWVLHSTVPELRLSD